MCGASTLGGASSTGIGISKDEAEQISKLASFVIEGFIVRSLMEYLNEQGITTTQMLAMQELGLVSGVEATRHEHCRGPAQPATNPSRSCAFRRPLSALRRKPIDALPASGYIALHQQRTASNSERERP